MVNRYHIVSPADLQEVAKKLTGTIWARSGVDSLIPLFKYAIFQAGGVAEWTKAAALKAVEGPVPSVGSNPTPSAKQNLFVPAGFQWIGPAG